MAAATALPAKPVTKGVFFVIAAYWVVVVVGILAVTLPFATDYVGRDNDDAMRLVEVRDYLAGQGWFDMMQYRLGLEPGTLMHWSRFIDWPIATLIWLSGLWFPPLKAEAVALAIWPLVWTLPVMGSLGIAALRLGGRVAMHVALGLTCLYLVTSNRFLPGSIDHHNVQIALVAFLAMALSVSRAWQTYALAGFACAMALAIGAETTPIIAVVCVIVAVQWGGSGGEMRGRTAAFSLSLTLFVTLLFFASVPPSHYRVVTCDNLSFGYYTLTVMGGCGLFMAAVFASRLARVIRLVLLLVIGAGVGLTAVVIAPQCLGNPLANLDPMLVTLWLNNVGEAMSFMAIAQHEPEGFSAFYTVGFLALLVCLFRLVRRDRIKAHAVWAAMLAVSWGISLAQVRGAMFSNMLTIVPLSLLIAELRGKMLLPGASKWATLTYIGSILISVPSFWAVVGVAAFKGPQALQFHWQAQQKPRGDDCTSASAFAQLAQIQATTVAAPSNSGTGILRFTHHRVLTAPYHRNQAGMLTELHIGLSTPADARAFLNGANVGVVAFCPSDPQTKQLIGLKPDGLYALLAKGQVPDYLKALPLDPQSGFQLYRVE